MGLGGMLDFIQLQLFSLNIVPGAQDITTPFCKNWVGSPGMLDNSHTYLEVAVNRTWLDIEREIMRERERDRERERERERERDREIYRDIYIERDIERYILTNSMLRVGDLTCLILYTSKILTTPD